MGRFLGITVKRGSPCRCLDGHVTEPYEMSVALGARPKVQLTFQLFILHVWLRITDEGSVPEMLIWSISLN